MAISPIRRSKHIAALSRDHHFGLLFCWKIKQGLKNSISLERIRSYINYFWDGHLKEHFREEEELLFNRATVEVCRQGRDEHEIIRLLIGGINSYGKNNLQTYQHLVSLMEQHIRYEERILFPHLEKRIPEEELALIGAALAAHHTEPVKDDYPDEFWVQEKGTLR